MLARSAARLLRKRGSAMGEDIPPMPSAARWTESAHIRAAGPSRPAEYRSPAIIRTFIKDKHVHDLQHLEIRGMYREELGIERGRFPNFTKVLTIGTDGVVQEREFESFAPAIVPLYNDRNFSHRVRVAELAKTLLGPERVWEDTAAPPAPAMEACNALEYPYCVPRKMPLRNPRVDPLNTKGARVIVKKAPSDDAAE